MSDKDITLAMLLEHMQSMGQTLRTDMQGMEQRLRKDMTQGFSAVDKRFDVLESKVSLLQVQVQNIDQRLDIIEISILDQKHEQRITHLERHAGFRTATQKS